MEKFILNEGFILSEKFILNEADESEFAIKSAEDTTQNAQLKTWKEKFESANNEDEYDEVLEEYVTEVFGAQYYFNKIKALGQAFQIELKHFGYDPDKNPFTQFLKDCFDDGINFSATTYGAVHNAYTANYINKADYSPIYKASEEPILYDKQLYIHNGDEVEEYLHLWNSCRSLGQGELNKIFYENNSLKNLVEIKSDIAGRGDINLKSNYKFNEFIKLTFGTKTPSDLQLKELLTYLVLHFSEDTNILTKYGINETNNLSIKQHTELNKKLKDIEITEDNAKEAIKELDKLISSKTLSAA